MRDRYLIANWKMNLPPAGIAAYCDALVAASTNDVTLVVAPPFVVLPQIIGRHVSLAAAAQDCSEHVSGAFTGEVAARMIRDIGARFVIVGHSERRTLHAETDEQVAAKAQRVLEADMIPVICVGESLEVREQGDTDPFIAGQLRAITMETASPVIVAYEPIWAIGTGRNATGGMVYETVAAIRRTIAATWSTAGRAVSVLYGGSVTPENVDELVGEGDIDGFLVGGASLDAAKFLAIRDGMLKQ